MRATFPGSGYPIEWLCKIYLEYACDSLDFKSQELEENALSHAEAALEKNPNSVLGKLAVGANAWKQEKDSAKARDVIKPVIDVSDSPNFYGAYILCFCHHDLGEYAECEALISTARHLLEAKVKEEGTRRALAARLKALLVRALYLQGSDAKMEAALAEIDAEPRLESEQDALLSVKIWAAAGRTEQAEKTLKT